MNGMSLARYIAADILEDSDLYGEKYYEEEDRLTDIIQNAITKYNLCKEEN